MGQALYRKYRSKSLDEVVGQGHIVTALQHALKRGNISHAYLFTGPRGVGKTSVARILAHEVNGIPYGDSSANLDIIEIDAASNRRIDEIRELRDKVHIAPAIAKYKVYIIDEVHMLTREAFNALLKTLEEPPAHVIFILATTESHKLPETIISRTQRFNFRPIEPDEAVKHLKTIAKKEKIDIDDSAIELIAEHGSGSFRDSISLLDQVRSQPGKITTDSVLTLLGQASDDMIAALELALINQDSSELVVNLQSLREQGYESPQVAKQLSARLRNELLTGKLLLSRQLSLKLLAALVDVPTSREPAIALEIALLEAISDDHATPHPVPATKSKEVIASPKPKLEEPQEEPIKAAEPVNTSTKLVANSAELDDELWQQVVESIRENHNTLYGVVRMAKATWNDTTLTLAFAFPFHQKRINDPKHRDMIAAAIKDLSGQEVTVTCIVDPSIKNERLSTEVVNTPADDPNIESITNIFGSAELLES